MKREIIKIAKRRTAGREAETLAKLARFQGALRNAPLLTGYGDDDDDGGDGDQAARPGEKAKLKPPPNGGAGAGAGGAGKGAAAAAGGYNGQVTDFGPSAEERILGYRTGGRDQGDDGHESDVSDGADIYSHVLVFDKSLRDIGAKKEEDLRDYEVVDPLTQNLAKGKQAQKWNKEEQKAKKRTSEWSRGARGPLV